MISFAYSRYLLLFLKNIGLGYVFWFPIFLGFILYSLYFILHLN